MMLFCPEEKKKKNDGKLIDFSCLAVWAVRVIKDHTSTKQTQLLRSHHHKLTKQISEDITPKEKPTNRRDTLI
jgi:hypothetical protein